MKNNKGFSLVELIIVIAIMAILVGVMAPQLIKYIEKTNVSSDAQLCSTVQTAVTTALTDAAVANETAFTGFKKGDTGLVSGMGTAAGGNVFASSMEETLGCSLNQVDTQLKSTLGKKSHVEYYFVSDSGVIIFVPQTDRNGSKTSPYNLNATNQNECCIFSGPIEMY